MLVGNILITGGTGTLGRAIIDWATAKGRQCTFTVYSRSEHRQAEMARLYPDVRYILGDIRDEARLRAAMAGHSLVIHAAAMKRIPECEYQPAECLDINVRGSQIVVRACQAAGIDRCIGISTDKACAAITTYGASKRAMEGLFQNAESSTTRFTLVRYGNVVASNGSVIPLWQRQAAQGQPLSVTGADMTRFWMSKLDAVALIDHATEMAPRTLLVPKMSALSLREMAEIIAPGAEITEVGVRSTEKTHEDLVHPDEGAVDTGQHFVLTPDRYGAGISYTSAMAPRVSPERFRHMLEVA